MTTGANFALQLNECIGHDYSAYFDPARANDIIKEALIKVVEVKYKNLTEQKTADELRSLISTSTSVTLTSNQVSLVTGIPNYLHTLAIKTKFLKPLASVKAASNTRPVVITLNKLTNLRDGDKVSVTGVLGNTAANGENYVKILYNDFEHSNFTLQLYTDEFLTVPVIGNGTYTKGGSVSSIVVSWVKKKESYRKYSTFGEPSISDPYYEIAQSLLKILPANYSCPQIWIDYLLQPPAYPDVTNSAFDLETVYPLRMLYAIIDETARLMGEYSRDNEQVNNSTNELAQP